MIISFGNSKTEKVWNGERVKGLPNQIQNIGRRKLRMLNNSINLADLKKPPSNRLEKLSGKLKHFIVSESPISGELFLNGSQVMPLRLKLLTITK